MDWAMTQTNLGNVLAILGQKRGDEALLKDAVTAYEAALNQRTQERVPMDWAMTWGNLGEALCRLGALKREAETIERGIAKIEVSLVVLNKAGVAGYAGVFKTKLIKAREDLVAIRSNDSPTS